MGIVASLKQGFSIAKQSFGLVLVLAVLLVISYVIRVPLNTLFANQDPNNPATAGPLLALGIVATLIGVAIQAFIQGGVLAYAKEKIKAGRATLGLFFGAALTHALKLFLLSVLIGLVLILFGVLAGFAIAIFAPNVAVIGVILAILIGAVAVYVAILLFFSPYSVVLDGKKIPDAIKTSMGFSRKHILKILGLALLLIAIYGACLFLLFGILGALSAVIKGTVLAVLGGIFLVFFVLLNSFFLILFTSSFTGFYLSRQGTASAN